MTPSVVYSVVQRHDQWHILRDGTDGPLARFPGKADAVDRARALALAEESAILRVEAVGGSIQSELVFGRDPAEMEGALAAG